MELDIFKIKTSKIPLLLCLIIFFGVNIIGIILYPSKISIILIFLGIAFLVPLHIVLYNTILTKLFIKGDTLIGLNGLLSRIKIPINRITFVTIIRNPLKVGGREVILLTKSRDLIKLHYIINYNELIDKLEELNKDIILDSRYYIK